MSFANEIKTQIQQHLKVFRSDNALEYTPHIFKHYLNLQGFVHETSCTYTPQQNGVAEHKQRHLLDVN